MTLKTGVTSSENSALPSKEQITSIYNNLHVIKQKRVLNCNIISQYYTSYYMFDQINVAL